MKRVLVVCGTAIATSTLVATRIREEAEKAGIQVHVMQARVTEVPNYKDSIDLIVSSTPVPYEVSVPVLNAMPLLTGIGEVEALAQILGAIKGE